MTEVLFPFPDSRQVAMCLDSDTLRYQCHAGLVVLRVVTGEQEALPSVDHTPWRDNEFILAHHLTNLLDEARERGIKVYKFSELNKILEKHPQIVEKAAKRQMAAGADKVPYPAWINDPTIQNRHRQILMAYDPEWYAQFNWDVPADPQES